MPLNFQDPFKDQKAMQTRGAFGKPNYYTPERIAILTARFGEEKANAIIARYIAHQGIYQRYKYKGKTRIVKWNFYPYDTTRTEKRGLCRDKFKAGMDAWKALSEEEKKAIHAKKRGRRMTDINFFLHKYMLDSI